MSNLKYITKLMFMRWLLRFSILCGFGTLRILVISFAVIPIKTKDVYPPVSAEIQPAMEN